MENKAINQNKLNYAPSCIQIPIEFPGAATDILVLMQPYMYVYSMISNYFQFSSWLSWIVPDIIFLLTLNYLLGIISKYVFFFSDVWGKFLEFEATCGDLASLVKVENRKLEAYKEVSWISLSLIKSGVPSHQDSDITEVVLVSISKKSLVRIIQIYYNYYHIHHHHHRSFLC